MARMQAADATLNAALAAHAGAEDRLSALIGDCHCLRANSTFAGPMDFGADDDEISITDFRNAADLDPNYFTKEGFGALIHRWGADVPVTLSPPVRRIRWDGPGVVAETPAGSLRAKAALVTVSSGVMQFEDLSFFPALTDSHLAAIFGLQMGLLTKIPVTLSDTRLGLAAFVDLLIERPARHDLFFLCFPFDLDLMVGFVGGDFAADILFEAREAAMALFQSAAAQGIDAARQRLDALRHAYRASRLRLSDLVEHALDAGAAEDLRSRLSLVVGRPAGLSFLEDQGHLMGWRLDLPGQV